MFEFIRTHNRLMQFLLLLLVFPAFVAIGFYGYSQADGGPAVATVGGDKITQIDWDQEIQRVGQEMRQADPSFDIALLDEPAQKQAILEGLIETRLLQKAVHDLRLQVGPQQVALALAQDPTVASLRDDSGKIDMQAYHQLLSNSGLTAAQFEAGVRQNMSQEQFQTAVYGTALTVAKLRDYYGQAFLQSRTVELLRLNSANYLASVQVDDAALQAFYDKNTDAFKTTEEVDVQYALLTPEAVLAGLSFSDEQLRSYFEQNQGRFAGEQSRHLRHIYFELPEGEAAQAEARSKAEAVLAQVKAAPESFAELARKESQDPGSAAEGGDLGFVAIGTIGDAAFDRAAFALQKNEISGVVTGGTGLHIIQALELRGSAKPFEAVREEVLAAVRAEQGAKKYAEAIDLFRDAVEDVDDLAAVAKQFNLEVQTVNKLQRNGAALAEVAPELRDRKWLAAIFAPEALGQKHNTAAFEVGGNNWVAGRVLAHRPVKVRPLSEVREQAVAMYKVEQAQAKAVAAAAESKKAWQAGETPSGVEKLSISRLPSATVPAAVVEQVMQADVSELPVWLDVTLPGNGGQALLRITSVGQVQGGPELEAVQAQLGQGVQEALSRAELNAFLAQLKKKYKVKIKVPQPTADAAAKAEAEQG